MTNWKTFIGGLIVALGVLYAPIVEQKRTPTLAEIVTACGAFGLGTSSKDKDVTGAGDSARRV